MDIIKSKPQLRLDIAEKEFVDKAINFSAIWTFYAMKSTVVRIVQFMALARVSSSDGRTV